MSTSNRDSVVMVSSVKLITVLEKLIAFQGEYIGLYSRAMELCLSAPASMRDRYATLHAGYEIQLAEFRTQIDVLTQWVSLLEREHVERST